MFTRLGSVEFLDTSMHMRLRAVRSVVGVAAAIGILGMAGVASANLVITPTFGSSITNDPNAATIESTINTAIGTYEAYFATPINVSIKFKEMGSGLGMSETYYAPPITYSQYYHALATHATTTNDAMALASLPVPLTANSNNPVTASSGINMTLPLARALGLNGTNFSGSPDGTVLLNTSTMNLSRASTNSSKYDLQTVVYHEINEVLGLGSSLDGNTTTPTTSPVNPEDLFRYSAANTRSYTVSSAATVFRQKGVV